MVEILIAIVLVGILSAVVVIGVARLTDTGNAAACTASADAARAGSMSYFAAHLAQPTTLAQLISPDDYLTLDDAVTLNATAVGSYPAGTVATGPGWTLTITPGANGRTPTFTCNAGTAPPAPAGTALCPGQYTGWVAEYYTNTDTHRCADPVP